MLLSLVLTRWLCWTSSAALLRSCLAAMLRVGAMLTPSNRAGAVPSSCRALENDMAPILVVATNRGITRIRGTNYRWGPRCCSHIGCHDGRCNSTGTTFPSLLRCMHACLPRAPAWQCVLGVLLGLHRNRTMPACRASSQTYDGLLHALPAFTHLLSYAPALTPGITAAYAPSLAAALHAGRRTASPSTCCMHCLHLLSC
jgi:hypothetical protein